jgi:hypothetical protein
MVIILFLTICYGSGTSLFMQATPMIVDSDARPSTDNNVHNANTGQARILS